MRACARALAAYLHPYRGLPPPVWILTAAASVNFLGDVVMTFLFLHLTVHLGAGVAAAGQVLGLYGAGSLIGSILAVRLNERFDSRTVLIGSLLWSGVGLFLLGFCSDLAWMGTIVAILALGTAAFRPAYNVTLARLTPQKDHARAYSLFHVASNVAWAMATLLGAYFIRHHLLYLTCIDALTALGAAVILWRCLPQELLEEPGSPVAPDGAPRLAPDASFCYLCLLVFTVACVYYQKLTAYPEYLHDAYNFSPRDFGYLMSASGFLILICEIPVVYALRRLPNEAGAALGTILVCAAMGILPAGRSAPLAFLSMMVLTLGEIILFPKLFAIVAEHAGRSRPGRYISLYNATFAFALTVAPVVGSNIYTARSAETLWHLCTLIGMAVALGFLSMAIRSHRPVVLGALPSEAP